MEKQEPKKTWVTPGLIVLVRSKPEESVLSACKLQGPSVGAQDFNSGCYVVVTGCGANCEGSTGS